MASCGTREVYVSSAGWHPDTGNRLWHATIMGDDFMFDLPGDVGACDALVVAMEMAQERSAGRQQRE